MQYRSLITRHRRRTLSVRYQSKSICLLIRVPENTRSPLKVRGDRATLTREILTHSVKLLHGCTHIGFNSTPYIGGSDPATSAHKYTVSGAQPRLEKFRGPRFGSQDWALAPRARLGVSVGGDCPSCCGGPGYHSLKIF